MTATMTEELLDARGVVRVLVVDDTPTLRMLTRLALAGTGFEVVGEAGDGLAGLEQAKALQPDLVLLDLAMPVMDGLEALPLIRAALPQVRVVIVSGFDRRAMEEQVIAAGADAYLQKGLSPDNIVDELRRLFPAAQSSPETAPRTRLPELVPSPRLSVAPDRARELEEELQELLYVVSHDVAEPVHVIKGFAQRLARRAHSDEEAEFCEYILSAADRMQDLLDDLLHYARAGQAELPRELLDLRRLTDGVLAGLESRLAESGARVTTGDLPREVVASRFVLTQVLHNVVGNAVKFTRPGVPAQVRIEGATTPAGDLVLRVRDNGIGIPDKQLERIFAPFKRLHSRERYPGSGIGLAICRRLLARCGGRISVESSDEGSTFVIEVPR
jgi:two-component system sensor histidine kinase/response regulator